MPERDLPLYQQIAESLRRRIAAGELAAGERLPPVREAARAWGCTPGTIARAYGRLAAEGLVQGRAGGGTRVASGALAPQDAALGWADLVNRAEAFLLEAAAGGHSPAQAEAAVAIAEARLRDLREAGAGQPEESRAGAIRFAGSHDLAVEVLAAMVGPSVVLETSYVGSLGGLMALARGESEVAGAHLWDEATGEYNVPFVRRLLPGRRVVLVTLVHRSLGLITAPGNPESIGGLADLPGGARFVNRQPGSGTRVWLDAHLRSAGIDPASITGYERVELTHHAVARTVEGGEADVGLGIGAAAAASGLGFVPLTRERYDLVFPAEVWERPEAHDVAAAIRDEGFRSAVAALGGYDLSGAGEVSVVEA
jgi:molybdate-binding protein/DNA-binding transcriptional regulator YhcF (GntR family)